MKAKLLAITIFATVDAFFVAFTVGFNSRHALVGDPAIPAPAKQEAPAPIAKPVDAAAHVTLPKEAGGGHKDGKAKSATHAKASSAHDKTGAKPATEKAITKPSSQTSKAAKSAANAASTKAAGKGVKPVAKPSKSSSQSGK
ncbi:MAG: hypothetical protein K2X93_16880 [Candidatus Obscuribacterales bacterium]|nr:hypothetical protein [Candidatus Obscuribacterales bacterium]